MPRRPEQLYQLKTSLDRAIPDACRAYVRDRRVTTPDLEVAFRELTKLRLGQEPNYETPHFAIPYALKLMAHRATSALISLGSTGEWPSRSVLDVGSGTGAVPFALAALFSEGKVSVDRIEPAADTARLFDGFWPASLDLGDSRALFIEELTRRPEPQPFRRYGSVILSATLPYEYIGDYAQSRALASLASGARPARRQHRPYRAEGESRDTRPVRGGLSRVRSKRFDSPRGPE